MGLKCMLSQDLIVPDITILHFHLDTTVSLIAISYCVESISLANDPLDHFDDVRNLRRQTSDQESNSKFLLMLQAHAGYCLPSMMHRLSI